MKKYAEIDATKIPVIKVTFTGNKASVESFNLYLNDLKQIYRQQKTIAIIFDAANAVIPGIYYQKLQAEWLKENEKLMVDYCAGTAYIIPNIIVRNVLKAIFAFQKQPVDYLVCKNESEASEWIWNKLN